jgi:hypothetical protein
LNPFYRPTALECIKSPIFDEIREKKNELASFKKLMLELDQDDAYDYDDDSI